jgi:S1-C subfamily serine protease
LVRTGGGYGSGFLVSSDGYILTAAHVVGDATAVKIRWSDKKETDGVVVRVSKGRDVALIKTDPRGRAPLPLRMDPPAPGETVFVVGAPWEQELQNTITRGVLSANRVKNGYTYIQSDVAVGFGASGGPLLDEKGRILGLTDTRGTLAFGAATGINFFVPALDALKFISVEPR